MSAFENFTDADGRVFLHGQLEPALHVAGLLHKSGCNGRIFAELQIGKPAEACTCEPMVLMAWSEVTP